MDVQFYLVSSNFITLMQIGNTKGEVVGFFKKVIVILVKRGPWKITSLLFYRKLSNCSFDLNWWQWSNRNSLMNYSLLR